MTLSYARRASCPTSRFRLDAQLAPLVATAGICALLYIVAALRYRGFLAPQVFVNFFADNAFLGVAAVGLTFVILSGGIDLSVGAMIGFTSIVIATLIQHHGVAPWLAVVIALAVGGAIGLVAGCLIEFGGVAPFPVTLGAVFLFGGRALYGKAGAVPTGGPLFSKL